MAGRELLNCGWNLKKPTFLLGTKPFTCGTMPTPILICSIATLTFNTFHICQKWPLKCINLFQSTCLSWSPSPSPDWEIPSFQLSRKSPQMRSPKQLRHKVSLRTHEETEASELQRGWEEDTEGAHRPGRLTHTAVNNKRPYIKQTGSEHWHSSLRPISSTFILQYTHSRRFKKKKKKL